MYWKSIFLAAFLLLFNLNSNAVAECQGPRSVSEELQRADAVFSGKVIAEEYQLIETGEDAGAKALVIKLRVDRWWKGADTEEVYLYTTFRKLPNGNSTEFAEDFRFRQGERYLVYAFEFEGKLQTNQCHRTSVLSKAEEDLRELGEGREPIKK